MPVEETQDESETKDSIHHATVDGPGEEIPGEAIPIHSREGRVQQFARADRDSGEDMVPEPSCQSQETARSRAGEVQDHGQSVITSSFWWGTAPGTPRPGRGLWRRLPRPSCTRTSTYS